MSDPKGFELHSEFCKCLIHPSRLRILEALSGGERSFADLPQATDLSRHLSLLIQRGVVRRRRDGKNLVLSITNAKILSAYELMSEALREIIEQRMHAVAEGTQAATGGESPAHGSGTRATA